MTATPGDGPMAASTERRKNARGVLSIPAIFTADGGAGVSTDVIKGRIANLAPEGGLFLGEPHVPQGATGVVTLGPLLSPTGHHAYRCRVVWSDPASHRHGLAFASVPAEAGGELRRVVDLARLVQRERFSVPFIVYLKDTNAEGNVYFAHYFDWQGVAREAFLGRLLRGALDAIIRGELRLITVDAAVHFRSPVFLFDQVEVWVKPTNVKPASVDLEFSYVKPQTGEEVATGRQTIAFADAAGKLMPIPRAILETGRVFLDDLEHVRLLQHLARPAAR